MGTVRKYRKAGVRAKVVDVLERSPDAEFILEGDEFDLSWTEEERPLHWFRVADGESVAYYAENSVEADDLRRVRDILAWGDARGGLSRAIHESPILAWDNGEVLDGAHRLVAALQNGLRKVTVLVGHRR